MDYDPATNPRYLGGVEEPSEEDLLLKQEAERKIVEYEQELDVYRMAGWAHITQRWQNTIDDLTEKIIHNLEPGPKEVLDKARVQVLKGMLERPKECRDQRDALFQSINGSDDVDNL